ncbi:MAG: translation elongation factor Ts [Dehalococcoidia bacterium]|nr:translation elongation factor Ts [Dehalococcoidia bacterium]
MAITADDVKRLREETGAGMLDCKNALEKAAGDFEKAKGILRKKGFDTAMKRAERVTADGTIETYMHHNKRLAAMVEINCETDFVARTDDFKTLAQQVALHIAGANPLYVTQDEVPADCKEDPKEVVLLLQPFVQDESRTVGDLVNETIARTGENIRIRRFARFELGR